MLSEFSTKGQQQADLFVPPSAQSNALADGSGGPDQSQEIGARRLCQSRHGVIRVDYATRTLESLLHNPLGGPAGGEVEPHSPAQTSYGRRIYL